MIVCKLSTLMLHTKVALYSKMHIQDFNFVPTKVVVCKSCHLQKVIATSTQLCDLKEKNL